MSTRTFKFEALSRVEGEGSVTLKTRDGNLAEVNLRIFEPPRFFEAFLVGRSHDEVPDITSRICGICPIAYQTSSATAFESLFGITLDPMVRELRRLIYAGEWIESHALHIHMLHAPDFLGYDDAVKMAADEPEAVKRGLRIKKVGNAIMTLVGGREIHPINIRVGGFYAAPTKQALLTLRDSIKAALDDAILSARWVSDFEFPDFNPQTEYVSMRHGTEYPIFEGRLVSTDGLDIALSEFGNNFQEHQEPHAHALHCLRIGVGPYQVGPLARYNLNRELLSPLAREMADELKLGSLVTNPFKSIIVRAVETIYALEESLRIIDGYDQPSKPCAEYKPVAGVAHGCSEAPRGMCYHRYEVDREGMIAKAQIVPPTSQNQARIELDLREWIPAILHLPEEKLRWKVEQAVRNYDPCISCATHFLRLKIEEI